MLDTPSLWVDLNQLEANIATLADFFRRSKVDWRPHVKGIKIPAILHKALKAGAIGGTCAKTSEAEVMVNGGIRDILIANQIVGQRKIEKLARLCQKADVKVAVDHPNNVKQMGVIATQNKTEIGVLIEINTGMNRAGIQPGQPAVDLALLVDETPGLNFRGLMAWEGHAVSIENECKKRETISKSVKELHQTIEMVKAANLTMNIVSGGGSGTYNIITSMAILTEVQAGGAIFGDASYCHWGAKTQPSLFVRSMVTSRPDPYRIIFDAGFKALPAWAGQPPIAVNLPGFETFHPSAEHGTVKLTCPNYEIQPGQIFNFIVGYGDSTVFLHDKLYGIRGESIEIAWPILGRGKIH